MNRIELKEMAKQQIQGKIGILFIITLVMVVISYLGTLVLSLVPFAGTIASYVLITAPLELGIIIVYLKVANYDNVSVSTLFEGYKDIWSAFKLYFLASLFIGLWTLLLIVPGIIKGISYSMAPYILAENKGMDALEAINKSKQMMEGHKMDYFILGLSFIGWGILTTLTFGIAGIWTVPYMQTTFANFYNKFKNEGSITIESEATIVE